MPPIKATPIEDILAHHRHRYILDTSMGTIVLKHITKRMMGNLNIIRMLRYPGAAELDAEAEIVYPIALAEGADEDTVRRANEIAADLKPTMDLYALGCIEYPFLTTADDLDALWESLEDDEQEALRQLLTLLTSFNYPIDYSALEIAEKFHFSIVSKENIINPTYEQYLALHAVIEAEQESAKKMYRNLGVTL